MLRFAKAIALAALMALGASAAGGWTLSAASLAPAVIERAPFVLVDTPVEEMPAQSGTAYVRGIQEELAAHGYDPGPADGLLGAQTRAAIREYQRDAGRLVTGEATKELLDHLMFHLPKIYADTHSGGVASSLVLSVQEELDALGYDVGRIDGVAGPITREAVRRFQNDAGLPVTGEIDGLLLDELRSGDPSIPAW